MSFRFFKRVRILPGVGLNFGTHGASVSVGPRGFKLTFSPRGVRGSIGLPGTGGGCHSTSRAGQHRHDHQYACGAAKPI